MNEVLAAFQRLKIFVGKLPNNPAVSVDMEVKRWHWKGWRSITMRSFNENALRVYHARIEDEWHKSAMKPLVKIWWGDIKKTSDGKFEVDINIFYPKVGRF